MTELDRIALSWMNAGSTYYAVHEDRVVALLYLDKGGIENVGGFDGTWMVVMADRPDDHLEVDAPPITPEMGADEMATTTSRAFSEASALVNDHLGLAQ
jgi:hypothetical protein